MFGGGSRDVVVVFLKGRCVGREAEVQASVRRIGAEYIKTD